MHCEYDCVYNVHTRIYVCVCIWRQRRASVIRVRLSLQMITNTSEQRITCTGILFLTPFIIERMYRIKINSVLVQHVDGRLRPAKLIRKLAGYGGRAMLEQVFNLYLHVLGYCTRLICW